MPTLSIGYGLVHGVDGWVALITNTNPPIYRTFIGDTIEPDTPAPSPEVALRANPETEAAVQRLAAAMKQGQAAVIEQQNQIFAAALENEPNPEVLTLFSTTNDLSFAGKIIFETIPSEVGAEVTLLNDLEAAGEALAEVLP